MLYLRGMMASAHKEAECIKRSQRVVSGHYRHIQRFIEHESLESIEYTLASQPHYDPRAYSSLPFDNYRHFQLIHFSAEALLAFSPPSDLMSLHPNKEESQYEKGMTWKKVDGYSSKYTTKCARAAQ